MEIKRFWFLIQQDIDHPVGGVKQIYRFADILSKLGFYSCVVQKTEEFRPLWFKTDSKFKTISYQKFKFLQLDPNIDYIILPETFLPIFFQLQEVPKIIFNQNMHYVFGENMSLQPSYVQSVYSSESLAHVLTVSHSDYSYISDLFPLRTHQISLFVNAIETNLFNFSFSGSKVISYMPRKNSAHSRNVLHLLNQQTWFIDSGWQIVPIHDMPQDLVSSTLQSSSIFLAFGYPEGFGLPLAEALACGCIIVGYDGIGGREISSVGKSFDVFSTVCYRDFYSFLLQIRNAIDLVDNSPPSLFSNLSAASRVIKNLYCHRNMVSSIEEFLQRLLS